MPLYIYSRYFKLHINILYQQVKGIACVVMTLQSSGLQRISSGQKSLKATLSDFFCPIIKGVICMIFLEKKQNNIRCVQDVSELQSLASGCVASSK